MKHLIIDSNFMCWRAFHALGGKLSYDGQSTSTMHGFLVGILHLWSMFKPCRFIFAWDSRKSVRRVDFPGYKQRVDDSNEEEKAIRTKVYEEISILRKDVLPSFGFRNNFMVNWFEADDIMARSVTELKSCGNPCTIVTADEDMFQCLDQCNIWNPIKRAMMTKTEFKRLYDIEPRAWAEVKTLAGCTSDTIPGCPGIGEKNAIKYLKGQLSPCSVRYTSIQEYLNSDLSKTFRRCIVIPHCKMDWTPNFQPDEWDDAGFDDVVDTFGLDSISQDKAEWEGLVECK